MARTSKTGTVMAPPRGVFLQGVGADLVLSGANVLSASGSASSASITNDTATNATMYPVWVTAATGSLPLKVSSMKMSFNPSTGLLSATGFAGNLTGNTSGNAATVTTNANLSGPVTSSGNMTALNAVAQAIPNGWTATTQAAHDNSTKLATTAYADAVLAGGLSVVVTTAPLTGGGTPGSMTFTNGILTAQVAAT